MKNLSVIVNLRKQTKTKEKKEKLHICTPNQGIA